VLRATAATLRRAGFDVVVANDGPQAMSESATLTPDLAIVDLGMPTSGLTVVRNLKEQFGPALHITVLTGRADLGTRLAAFDAGADDFLVKPASPDELQRKMTAAARSHHAFVEARMAQEHADRLLAYGMEAGALLAHDLNNGLAVALSSTTYLRDELTGMDEQDRRLLTTTVRVLQRMVSLVSNFVDISRFEDTTLVPDFRMVEVKGLLQDVLNLHIPAPPAQVAGIAECPDQLEGFFDSAIIERVLHNVVGNAMRYCGSSGTIRLSARAWPEGGARGVALTVWNNGPLVPEEIVPKLFGKYVVGKQGKRGMGLYFSRLACEAHGGNIDYLATENGPSFVMYLPDCSGR
jgi:signal transduction histidine kinase